MAIVEVIALCSSCGGPLGPPQSMWYSVVRKCTLCANAHVVFRSDEAAPVMYTTKQCPLGRDFREFVREQLGPNADMYPAAAPG